MGAYTFVHGVLVPEAEKTGFALPVSYAVSGNHVTWSYGVAAVCVPHYAGASRVGGFVVAACRGGGILSQITMENVKEITI